MKHFDQKSIEKIAYEEFIPFLKDFYKNDLVVPPRPHYQLPGSGGEAVLLIMPAWQEKGFIGVKIINVFPDNADRDLPSIQGTYLLMSADDGSLLASFDGPALTTKRTAAVSGLASQLISRGEVDTMLMLGTGNLCHELIMAHHAIRPIQKVFIWGRNYEKARQKARTLKIPRVEVKAVKDKSAVMPEADLISAATYARQPIISGELVSPGTHLDLVGSYTPDRREADNNCLTGNSLFVDDYNAIKESGDLSIPISEGIIQATDIKADLKKLSIMGYNRQSAKETTVFKSVGNAKSDLAMAVFLFQKSV